MLLAAAAASAGPAGLQSPLQGLRALWCLHYHRYHSRRESPFCPPAHSATPWQQPPAFPYRQSRACWLKTPPRPSKDWDWQMAGSVSVAGTAAAAVVAELVGLSPHWQRRDGRRRLLCTTGELQGTTPDCPEVGASHLHLLPRDCCCPKGPVLARRKRTRTMADCCLRWDRQRRPLGDDPNRQSPTI